MEKNIKFEQNTPLWDNSLSIEERLDYLTGAMTLEEKIHCLTTGCPDIPRLGIRATYMGGEAAHGIEARHDQAFNKGEPEPTTAFTQPIGMSASFDRELIRECGRAVGEEARALYTRNGGGGLCRWAPTIDMERDPRWGRTEESYGEDPYLTGEMAGAYIRGMRGEDPFYIRCGATLKHFYANNVEKDRIKISSSVDRRNKNKYYLKPFKKAIMEGGAEAVMTSYNEINGIPAIVNDEVRHVLKGTYGLPGHVVCDGGDFSQTVNDHHFYQTHGETLANGLKAGVDCFTDDGELVYAAAREALDNGWITEKDIDESVRNSFRTRIRLGMFDKESDCPYQNMGEEYINNGEHKELARKMADEAVVLLKNENGILPLDEKAEKKIAVVGPLADVWYKDWYCGIPPYAVTVLDGIREVFPNAEISHETGLSEIQIYLTDQNGEKCYVGLDQNSRLKLVKKEQAETFIFNDWGCGSMTLVAKSNGMFVTLEENTDIIKADKKEAFGWFVHESWNFRKNSGKNSFALESWNNRWVFVDKNGYFSICVDNPAAEFEIEIVKNGKTAAEKMAKEVDYVLAVIGCNPVINSKEEVDRTTIALPPEQEMLVEHIAAVNPNTIVILISNYPYAIGKLQEKVPSILLSASGSQELGNGIADVLTGKAAAAGRVNMTWYHSDEDLPDMNDYDIIQGKRTYQYFDREVLYPFGYGMSYTTFSYEKMQIKKERGCIKVSCFIRNTGEKTGDEVVQLYVHKKDSRVKRPIKQLAGFERVHNIKPKEVRKVNFTVQLWELEYYDVISERMILEDGNYQFMVGASSQDIRLEQSIMIDGLHAGKRNPFQTTAADCYDAYDHMFLHRGINGSSCVIPGSAGDDPDMIGECPVEGTLIYHDFVFYKKPRKLNITLKVLETAHITVTGENGVQITAEPVDCYRMLEIDLPEDFIDPGVPETIQIQVEGKCKISKFVFA